MATVNQIKIIVEAEDKASAPIERATKSTRNLGRASREVTRESKKEWGGLVDLFGQVLPRNLQMLQRGFKGTQRQVGRLSKSFKILKTAWASIGIGLIIIAVEELVSNWDEWSERLGITNKQEKEAADLNKQITASIATMGAETASYVAMLATETTGTEERAFAAKELNKQLGNFIDLEADATTQMKQAMWLQGQLLSIERQRIIVAAAQQKFTEAEIAYEKAATAEEEAAAIIAYQAAYEDLNKVTAVGITLEAELTAALQKRGEELQKLEKAERDAEAKKKKSIQDAEANAEWLANQRIQLAQETELRLIQDEEKRDLRSLEIQHKAAKKELAARGGEKEDLLALEDAYIMDKAEIEKDYQEQRDDKQDELDAQALADAETVRQALATDQQNEIFATEQHYTDLLALAQKDSQEYIDLEQQEKDALDKINEDYATRQREADQKTQLLKIAGAVKMANAVRGVLGSLGDMAEEGSKQQQNLAIVDVLLAQAISVANAIAGATKAGMGTGTAAPFTTPIFIAQMVGSVLASFAGVKSILDKAGASAGGIGGGGGGGGRGGFAPVSAQVPLPARLDTPDSMQAYVVQSQLQGQQNAQGRLHGQIVL
mgnify:CR=1 FL=1